MEVEKSLCCWKSPPKCIINIAEFLERAKSYVHIVVTGLLEDPQETSIVSVFVLDKNSRKFCRFTKYTEVKSREPLGLRPQRIVKVKGFFTWNILFPSQEIA